MAILGCLDSIEHGTVRGWSFDDATGRSSPVSIIIDGYDVGSITGNDYRSDLADAGLGDGYCGFRFVLPELTSLPTIVRVISTGGRFPLVLGERIVGGDFIPKSDLFSVALANGLWMSREIVVDGIISIEGWAVAPYGMPIAAYIAHNGTPLTTVSSPPAPDVIRRLGLPENSGAYNFLATGPIDPKAGPSDVHEFTFVDAHTNVPFNRYHSIYYQREHDGPVPDAARRKRVGGDPALAPFLLQGRSAYERLRTVLADYFDTSFERAERILDWGCGCGRVFSHLPAGLLDRLTGIDIDGDNVGWCQATYPDARFLAVPLQPPTTLEDGCFDVVFAISVLTHLREADAEAWIRELQRITRPGAAVLVTILGETAWLNSAIPLENYGRYRTRGFAIDGKNNDLDDSDTDASGYYNAFISRRFVYERFGVYFQVLDVIAGGIGNHQDLVVLRRP